MVYVWGKECGHLTLLSMLELFEKLWRNCYLWIRSAEGGKFLFDFAVMMNVWYFVQTKVVAFFFKENLTMSYLEKMYESPMIWISCWNKGYIEDELICFVWVDCVVKASLSLILLNNLCTNGVRVIGWWILWRKNVINWCMCSLSLDNFKILFGKFTFLTGCT